MHPLQQFFGQIPLFSRLSGEELNEILRGIQPVSLRAGQRLFTQGDPGDAAYVVQSGEIEIFTEPAGHEVAIATLGANEVLGELSLIDGTPRSASARAVQATELFRLDKSEFDFLRRNMRPEAYKLMRGITRSLCERIRETNEHIADLISGERPESAPPKQVPARHWIARMLTRGKEST